MDNFLTNSASLNVFGEKTMMACYRHQISAAPFVRSLECVHGVARGLGELFTLLQVNETQRLSYADRDEGEAVTPPLPPNSVDNFMALGASVCELLRADIERLAKWAGERADDADQQTATPSSSRRGRKAQDSSKAVTHA
ncbi:hypothetical protein AWB75_07054 [Caballeronia catudaia]|uniref:Uncharacterized protein n=1 Tax=Caballeronia catudaia TaxID=1777136 RepID=A0A158DQH2_9BURK|nr:hypothetical protein [Caballeronia catudaia]SAK96854.1 hypothetical protein AWB75_07054 [Caballeronia catudaia]